MIRSLRSHLGLLALATLSSGAAFGQVSSQLPISRVAGMVDVSVPANAFTYVGLPFIKAPVASGELSAIAGTTLTDSTASFGDLTTTPHAVQIIGGPGDGSIRRITGNTGTTITIDSAVTGLVASLSRYEIIPEWTLGEVLGATNQAGLTAASSGGGADKVLIESDGVITTYFYKTQQLPISPGTGWRLLSAPTGADQTGVRIPLKGGLVINRIAGSPLTLTLHGVTRTGTQAVNLVQGQNILTNPFFNATTLGNSGFAAALTAASSGGNADQIRIEVGGVISTYFFKSEQLPISPGSGWRLVSAPTGADQSGVVIQSGKAVIVNRKAAGSSIWSIREQFVTGP